MQSEVLIIIRLFTSIIIYINYNIIKIEIEALIIYINYINYVNIVVDLWLTSDTDPIWPTQTTPSQGENL